MLTKVCAEFDDGWFEDVGKGSRTLVTAYAASLVLMYFVQVK
jgi:hypothetical protein